MYQNQTYWTYIVHYQMHTTNFNTNATTITTTNNNHKNYDSNNNNNNTYYYTHNIVKPTEATISNAPV